MNIKELGSRLVSRIRTTKGPARDKNGKFTSGEGGLSIKPKLNLKRIAPVVIVVSIIGGFSVYRSMAASVPQCAAGTTSLGTTTGYRNGKKFTVRLCRIPGFKSKGSEDGGYVRVSSKVSSQWRDLYQKAKKSKITLVADSSFRSHKKQQDLYACYQKRRCNYAAVPGYSNHQAGEAVDIDIVPGPNNDPSLTTCKKYPSRYPVYNWLSKNARWYGMKAAVASECWHWSPTGN